MTRKRATVLLDHYLKQLKLPTMLREYKTIAQTCAQEDQDHLTFLLRLIERETLEREQRASERCIRAAKFPVLKTLDTFDFAAQPSINKALMLELMRCEYLDHKENILFMGNPGTGKTHLATALGHSRPADVLTTIPPRPCRPRGPHLTCLRLSNPLLTPTQHSDKLFRGTHGH